MDDLIKNEGGMKCLILAAGYATRLYPLTENYPKPLLLIKGKPILDWLLDDIDTCGLIDEYIVISNHKYTHHFEKWAAGKTGFNITVLDDGTTTNETRLGAVNDIQFAIESLSLDTDMLVIAGDNVIDFSFVKFIRYALEKDSTCTMRYYEPSIQKLQKCGVFEVNSDGRVVGMEEKPVVPKSNWCGTPFYFYTRKDLKRVKEGIEAGCGTDAPGSFISWLSSVTPVYAMELPGHRFDVGNLEGYKKICEEYQGITIK